MYRSTVFLPIKLVNQANDENWIRSLAYLVRLKAIYKNGTFYKFSLRGVADKIQCSPACLSHHLKVLESKGLVRYHSGNLTLVGLKKLSTMHNARLTTGIIVQFKNQFDILRSLIIKFNLQRQAYKIRRQEKLLRKKSCEIASENYVGLSCKRIGYLYGLSKESGSRIRRKLETIGLIKSERVYKSLAKGVCYEQYKILKYDLIIPQWAFFKNGQILVQKRMKMEYIIAS
jgi:DNA-binding MarR family transcriptional regulator